MVCTGMPATAPGAHHPTMPSTFARTRCAAPDIPHGIGARTGSPLTRSATCGTSPIPAGRNLHPATLRDCPLPPKLDGMPGKLEHHCVQISRPRWKVEHHSKCRERRVPWPRQAWLSS